MANTRIDAAEGATTELIPAPGVGFRLEVLAIKSSTDATAGTIRFHDTSIDLWGDVAIPITVGINKSLVDLPYCPFPWFECGENAALSVTTTGTALVGLIIFRKVKV